MPRGDLIQYRRGTAAQWLSVNPVLADGEVGYDKTNGEIRIGDGAAAWSNLSPIGGGSIDPNDVAQAVADYLAQNPIEGVTEQELQDHIDAAEPHPAYDGDMPRLDLLFKNALTP